MSEITTVGGYELKNPVATGNASQVWEVVEEGGTTPFAMKLLLPETKSDPEQVKTLKHEAKVMKTLEHPNIIRFHEVVSNKKHCFFIMDYFKATNLKGQIVGDPWSVQLRLPKLVESLCMALQHVHEKGWVHRDIKPDNILFNRSSELRLIDFSLAGRKVSALGKLMGAKSKSIQGTRTYIAPETILKEAPSPQTDMYSVGILLYEIVTGHVPFRSSNPKELLKKHLTEAPPKPHESNPNVTPELEEFILRLLSKKPAERPQDMNEVNGLFRSLSLFHEDVMEVKARETKEPEFDERELGQLIDSRKDAERTKSMGGYTPQPASQPQQPQPGQYPQQPQQQPYPQQPQPGTPQPYPQQPQPYGQPQQQPFYGQQPTYPGQQNPSQYPPQQVPPQQPAAQLPPGQYPQQPQPGQTPYPGQQYPQQPGQYPQQPQQGQYPQQPQQGQYPQQGQQPPQQYPQQGAQPGQQQWYPQPGQQVPPGYYPQQPQQGQHPQQGQQPPQQYPPGQYPQQGQQPPPQQ